MEDLRTLRGVGAVKAAQLEKLGVHSTDDLMTLFPRRIEDRRTVKTITELQHGETVCVNATVFSHVRENYVRSGLMIATVQVRDETGTMECSFFNNRFLKNLLKMGARYTFYGTVRIAPNGRSMTAPLFEAAECAQLTKRLVPIYPLSAGITQKFLTALLRQALDVGLETVQDVLPPELRARYHLCSAQFALENIHFPSDDTALECARDRLVFEELFLFQTGLRYLKRAVAAQHHTPYSRLDAKALHALLPFSLTGAQQRVEGEIAADLSSGHAMNRLLQGDVGSGKTVVAAFALYLAVQNGEQSALMAPTEILAAQHYESLAPMMAQLGITVTLLTGSVSAKEKAARRAAIADGSAQIVIGTHALLEDNVQFHALGLLVTDEQHRFGVRQRGALANKGDCPHVLVMSATPIPRTLAITLYGELDVSVLDERPVGRKKIDTFCVGEEMRPRIRAFLEREIASGHQAYVVCPAVEDAPSNEAAPTLKSVKTFAAQLAKELPGRRVTLLHGKMPGREKQAIMEAFARGDYDVLVATTVIEVGINVPNATVMVIENAERFGLSQLHQLRGRVGRGAEKSYCILFCTLETPDARARMRVMVESDDGFQIAEQDLALRGPGDFFGTAQHGLPQLKIANLLSDMDLLRKSGEAAVNLLQNDPNLVKPSHQLLKRKIQELFEKSTDLFV